MHWFFRFGAAVLLVLGIATNAVAATPDGKTPDTAFSLPASLSASGTLTGSGPGSFAFYTFNPPATNGVGTITLSVSPADSNVTNAVGVNLYQSGATLLSLNALGSVSGTNSGTFPSSSASPILVQVYNYLPGQIASYNFNIMGLTAQPAEAPVAIPAAAPSTAAPSTPDGKTPQMAIPLPASLTTSGNLTGMVGGSFAFYTLNYPGSAAIGTIILNVNPTDSDLTNAVGVNLYQNGSNLVTRNALGAVSGSNFGVFSSSSTSPILIEVYNYLPGRTASYNVAVTGLTH